MATLYLLVVNFGANAEAARAAADTAARWTSVTMSGATLPVDVTPDLREFTVDAGIHHTGAYAVDGSALPEPTQAQLDEVAEQFFEMLREFSGYRAAAVGWNPEDRVELHGDEPARGGYTVAEIADLRGLVLAEDLCSR